MDEEEPKLGSYHLKEIDNRRAEDARKVLDLSLRLSAEELLSR